MHLSVCQLLQLKPKENIQFGQAKYSQDPHIGALLLQSEYKVAFRILCVIFQVGLLQGKVAISIYCLRHYQSNFVHPFEEVSFIQI